MRTFSSYGPVNERVHFCVERPWLVERCVQQLVGRPEEEGGHFFTLYASRQCGKTWLMRRAMEAVRKTYGERFLVHSFSIETTLVKDDDPEETFLERVPYLMESIVRRLLPRPSSWDEWRRLFSRSVGLFDRPVILLIDEFDKLPPAVIGRLVQFFRSIYLERSEYHLHGLALIGVRAVLGMDSPSGSPFNVQRSLRVPVFSHDEVRNLFQQYQDESGQTIHTEVVDQIYGTFRGQPGLTCWMGELLTERFNDDPSRPIDLAQWKRAYGRALHSERNNNVMNLVSKARQRYTDKLHALYIQSHIPFSVENPWCDYLELNGIITEKLEINAKGDEVRYCQFASPFVQLRLYQAFSDQLQDLLHDVPPLEGTDAMDDVFTADGIRIEALLQRYKPYLELLRSKGRDPFRDQPLRADFGLPEAVGHFHLYAWLMQGFGSMLTITPEFPTGNGKVDLALWYEGQVHLVEVKSLSAKRELERARTQAADYARLKHLKEVTLAVFVPTSRPELLNEFEVSVERDGVRVHTVAFGWRP